MTYHRSSPRKPCWYNQNSLATTYRQNLANIYQPFTILLYVNDCHFDTAVCTVHITLNTHECTKYTCTVSINRPTPVHVPHLLTTVQNTDFLYGCHTGIRMCASRFLFMIP